LAKGVGTSSLSELIEFFMGKTYFRAFLRHIRQSSPDFAKISPISPCFGVILTQYGHAFHIPRKTNQRPFTGDIL
jgi:hypothetical protein